MGTFLVHPLKFLEVFPGVSEASGSGLGHVPGTPEIKKSFLGYPRFLVQALGTLPATPKIIRSFFLGYPTLVVQALGSFFPGVSEASGSGLGHVPGTPKQIRSSFWGIRGFWVRLGARS